MKIDELRYVKDIYQLIIDKKYNLLIKKDPRLKDHIDFLTFIVSLSQSDEYNDNIEWFIRNEFYCCLKVCDLLKEELNTIKEEKELLIHLMSYFSSYLDKCLLLIFKPEYYLNTDLCYPVSIIYDLIVMDKDVSVKSTRIQNLFSHMDYLKNNHYELIDDSCVNLLLLYSFINNNYSYLYNYLNNFDFYNDKINLNFKDFINSSNDLYKNIDKVFVKQSIVIK